MKLRFGVMIAVTLSLLIVPPIYARQTETLTVFAAASLTDAFEELATVYEADHVEVDIVLNFSASSTLAAQISNGAPADVFASANFTQMRNAFDSGRMQGPALFFAYNRLTLAVPADNPAGIMGLGDLATPGVLIALAAPETPIRQYTDLMFNGFVETSDAAYLDALQANIVSEEPTVRQVVAKVALGEVDAGVVYTSDVTPDVMDAVLMLPIPEGINPRARYPIAALADSPNLERAQDFIRFVRSHEGQNTLESWGFERARLTVPADGTAE
jgi:molybdate transport system substrate-binding protein